LAEEIRAISKISDTSELADMISQLIDRANDDRLMAISHDASVVDEM